MGKTGTKALEILSLCQNRAHLKKAMSKNFLWGFNSMANKAFCTYVCSEITPTKTGQKNSG